MCFAFFYTTDYIFERETLEVQMYSAITVTQFGPVSPSPVTLVIAPSQVLMSGIDISSESFCKSILRDR